jgi:hypothetical protein
MTRHPNLALLVALAAGITFSADLAIAKRLPPADVPPVTYEGVRYEAPHFDNPCGQNGGCVVAYDDATGAQLWALKIYCTQYDSGLETDVQDVFITSLSVENGQLIVTNEKNLQFTIDPRTQGVSGDARGCEKIVSRGCSYSPTSTGSPFWILLSLLGLIVAVRPRWSRPRRSASRLRTL